MMNNEKLTLNEGFLSTINELFKDDQEIRDLIVGLSADVAENIDIYALNPAGLTWGAFKNLDDASRINIVKLINEFKTTNDREELKRIGKEMVNILEV